MNRKPNILFLIIDESRYPPSYETPELKQWKDRNLKFHNMLASIGTVFHGNYINTSACVPSRTTLQTGVYPSIHGNTSTDGLAKTPRDPDMHWLKPFTVPTIGNYMAEAGYDCYMRGKWHISQADITGLAGHGIPTFDSNGKRLRASEEHYLEENVLGDYGYNGWIGPDPHGNIGLNSASSVPGKKIGRDEKFVEQTVELLDELKNSTKPWYLNVNLVDPHDITLYGAISTKLKRAFEFKIDDTLPKKLFTDESSKTFNESLDTKPPTQKAYRELYKKMLQPITDIDSYTRYYYTLLKRVDQQLMKIWNKLRSMPYYKNTVVVFTSDHGDLLASHGGLFQKWYQAYEEVVHIPLIISSPLFGNRHQDITELTSHIDMLPTFLDMAGVSQDKIRRQLKNKFSMAVKLPGASLLPLVTGFEVCYAPRSVYFYTEDNISSGQNQKNIAGIPYEPIKEPSCVEAVIIRMDGKLWKYTSYYSNDPFFDLTQIKNELYNITDDPMEIKNLYLTADIKQKELFSELIEELSIRYRGLRNPLLLLP